MIAQHFPPHVRSVTVPLPIAHVAYAQMSPSHSAVLRHSCGFDPTHPDALQRATVPVP